MKIIKGEGVTKYIHDDGSETVIKTTQSMEYHANSLNDDFVMTTVDRNKYSILISTSVGCQMGCKMCGINPNTFKPLNSGQIIANVKDAVIHHDFNVGSLSGKYAKLCFMGMGESTLKSTNFSTVPASLIRFLTNKGFAKGIDSIDYGTILPKNRDKVWVKRVISLNKFMREQYEVNPANNHESLVRVFFSLHQLDFDKRHDLIPMGDHITTDLTDLIDADIEVIFHQTFIKGVNDSSNDVLALQDWFTKRPYLQLRILRYNTNGVYEESPYRELAWRVLSSLSNVKFQVSPGEEVNSACGQFY